MKSISMLIKAASGACNIDCSYCFYKDLILGNDDINKKSMTRETMVNLIDNTFIDLNKGDSIEFAFQGGEPTIIGIGFYKSFVDHVKSLNRSDINVSYSFQTNGILLDEEWCKFLKDNNFLIGLSLDGPKSINDINRLDYQGRGTFHRIMAGKRLLDRYRVQYNILSVLTNESSLQPEIIWNFIKDNEIKYIQFIPCLKDINNKLDTNSSLSPENFAYFYRIIFPLWEEAYNKGNYYSIGFIDEVIALLSGEQNYSCSISGSCRPQYVVEANGDIYPCDFYVLKQYKCGNINNNTLKEIFSNPNMQRFLSEKKILPSYCKKCSYLSICRGGCRRLKDIIYVNKAGDFCGYEELLNTIIGDY